jgi:hypothetical protein
VFAVGDLVEITAEVQNEKRDRVVARGAEDGIGVGGNGPDEREIDERNDELSEAAANGSVVVDIWKLGMELIPREPAEFFLGKRFGVSPVDSGIDFLELCDYIVNRELGEINHQGISWVSREGIPPSNTLSGNPFLFSCQDTSTDSLPVYSTVSSSSRSMKVGDSALRSCSRA